MNSLFTRKTSSVYLNVRPKMTNKIKGKSDDIHRTREELELWS